VRVRFSRSLRRRTFGVMSRTSFRSDDLTYYRRTIVSSHCKFSRIAVRTYYTYAHILIFILRVGIACRQGALTFQPDTRDRVKITKKDKYCNVLAKYVTSRDCSSYVQNRPMQFRLEIFQDEFPFKSISKFECNII
jgi:hypothetical protein